MTDEDDADLWDEVPPWESAPERDPDAPHPDLDVDEFLNEDEPEYDWVVPGLIERGDRLVLTGAEGMGKSTLLRQLAVQVAAGIHPFTLEAIDPVRVMVLDLENSKRHVRRKLRPLRLVARDLKPEQLRVRVRAEGMDLLGAMDEEWFEGRIQVNEPELVITGPLYKLASGDPIEEKVARRVALVLDRLRTRYNFALILEAHSPHAVGRERPERPYGASLWMRWPEFGLFLSDKGQLRHWRGPRDERAWPAALQRGGEWPWTPMDAAQSVTFARILEEMRNAGRVLAERELSDRLEVPKTNIHRAIQANRSQWETECGAF